jgi:hypothetical protein
MQGYHYYPQVSMNVVRKNIPDIWKDKIVAKPVLYMLKTQELASEVRNWKEEYRV